MAPVSVDVDSSVNKVLGDMHTFDFYSEGLEGCDWIWEQFSREQRELFACLPLDIVRLIFEKAMEDKPQPLHMVRVSRQTQRWLEPLIYEHVTLEDEEQFDQFYRTFRNRRQSSTKDLAFFQRYVRTFFIYDVNPRAEKLAAIIRELVGLRSLACWTEDWGKTAMNVVLDASHGPDSTPECKDQFPYAHLRRISFSAAVLHERQITFTHRMFRDLTHMDIYFHSIVDWETLHCLPSLTHISLDMVTPITVPNDRELDFWFSRILDACPPSTKVVIFLCVDENNADFDLIDSDGNYLPPGWPPRDLCPSALEAEDSWDVWLTSETKCHDNVDIDLLHPVTRLAFGRLDPRAVAASSTTELPDSHLFREYLIYFPCPANKLDWDGTESSHRECWTVAEEIIGKRQGLTYAKLISNL